VPKPTDKRTREALEHRRREYEQAKAELASLGYVLQGSVTQRWMRCGKAACRCHVDPQARHGPYLQWSWKVGGKTLSVYLEPDQATLCKEWIANARRLRRLIARLYTLSADVARLHEIPTK
jgi:hypothetical protein